ncbi:HAMP domain-containing histidine kinase [Candidatus Daviesbacteria bacterium]|nr:HAMP domain-containing histidine kinase [Candidatus Daviesbacteria bacterium]
MFDINLSEFTKARLKLTAWYILISFFMLAIFTFAAVQAEQRAFRRIQTVLGNPTTRPRLTSLLEIRINEFEDNYRARLLTFDAISLLISAILSFFLSGRTLRPIREMLIKQQEFAADASHELRTPLTTIGMEIIALQRTQKHIPEKIKTTLVSIEEEVKKMAELVDGLLASFRSETSTSKKHWQIFDLTEAARLSVAKMASLALQKGIDLRFKPDSKISVLGNMDEIKQAIIILLDNAIKYTPAQKSVIITCFEKKSNAIIEVKDYGIGIPEKDLDHIFDRFYRSEVNLSYKGSGLGLSIAKKIVESHGGSLSAESKINQGSKFMIELPVSS